MPSRKKAQGKTAKAKKAEEEGKKQSAVGRANNEQQQQQAISAQIQRLQHKICFQNTTYDDTTDDNCLHGHTSLPEDNVAHQFMKSFIFMAHY